MARRIIDIGIVGNDGTGDSIRDSFRKVNENFRELYSSLGLGEKLTFIGLDDTPGSYEGTVDAGTGNTPLVTVNNQASGLTFKYLTGGEGININFSGTDEIVINSEFAALSSDPEPRLGGPLSAGAGTENAYRIIDLQTPISPDEAVNKGYADTKISRAGTEAIDPASGEVNQSFGRMTGPLILSRDPAPEDDTIYDGLIAASKRYVDNAAFGSVANLFVAQSGQDSRPGVSPALQGRALAYAYKTLEAALKRAEEILLESRNEIGPYKKLLTYGNGVNFCYLNSIETSPESGTGFSGSVFVSVDTIEISSPGTNYNVGDILTITGGTIPIGGQPARLEVLSTASTPGAVLTFRVLSSGVYSAVPGSTNVACTSNSLTSNNDVTFNITYRVNNVVINPGGGGSGYGLVSVRIVPAPGDTTGSGAFGTAEVVGGVIVSITITDQGSGFTNVPSLIVDLPRFALFTDGLRTDFTGDVLTDTPEAFRGRDIREGLFLFGETSGALAQILGHTGELDTTGNELFDVDIQFGTFIIGEPISYGDVTKNTQITIIVESGIYEENYPLKVPQNVAIVGDEFRRVIVRPKKGPSSSPWAFSKFRRDLEIDGLETADRLYGYHYLSDSSQPVYPKIDNKGGYKASAQLISLNKTFLQEEIIAWMNEQISSAGGAGIWAGFEYDESMFKRDVGYIVDALIFDLRYGDYNRTISFGLKYYQTDEGRLAISADGVGYKSQTIATVEHLKSLILDVISNTEVTPQYSNIFPQIIDNAFVAENLADDVLGSLFTAFIDVIDGSGSVNYPKENDALDVFLCNDAVILRAVTGQGHGGFMMVLDPTGQILAKSPYAQECAAFSKSINDQTFAGGMFVDGFSGNLQFKHTATINVEKTRISVSELDRLPNLPASFIVDDTVHRVNYVRDFIYSPNGSTATFVLDETTPFTRDPGVQACTISVGSPAVITSAEHRLQPLATIVFSVSAGGSLPAGIVAGTQYYVSKEGLTTNSFRILPTPISTTFVATSSSGSGTFTFQRIYELLMPGNRSMLSNDFTQVNDLGYGIIATNGGLVEAVSMFTYYCHISYYSLNGGQIRSVGGSSAHGNYALVAEGSDPLEVPTPCSLYYDLSQRVECYFPSPAFANVINGLFIYVVGFQQTPLNNSELEIDHGNVIFRYPITSVALEEDPDPTRGVIARLNLTSDETGNFDGLFAAVADGTVMTLRQNSQIILTGNLVDVAVRPSTGLIFFEAETVYRVLQFEDFIDPNGPYPVTITQANPGIFRIKLTITAIASNVCTTSYKHNLRLGDKFIPDSNSNGFSSGVTYYVITIPAYDQFTVSTTPGGSTATLVNGTGLSIVGTRSHLLKSNFQITFSTDGTLPEPLVPEAIYYVTEESFTDTEFALSDVRSGDPLATTTSGSGNHLLDLYGLTKTTLRENYNFIDLTVWQPGEYVTTGSTCTVSVGEPATFNLSGHTFAAGDVVKFTTTDILPAGLSLGRNYHVISDGLVAGTSFQVSAQPNGVAGRVGVGVTNTGSGTLSVGLVNGRAGDNNIAVVPVGPEEESRIPGSKFVFRGEEYIITTYQNQTVTNLEFARVVLNRPLVHSIIAYAGSYTMKAAVPIRSNNADGDLTIRISLTRVTSHDLLDIGTGSYADTNYPNEIYGPPVNALNEANETEERDVGRVFYVTTDQFGNFNVGPFFRVDQGTGRVTFSAAIALSNLDGIGFKRGVPIAEFSTDSGFTDNATDTVPTENAARIYIERRLGLTHSGAPVVGAQLIPPVTGGFMALDGQLSMKADMSLGGFKITNVGDPVNTRDAVNLRSLTVDNFQDFEIGDISANDILIMTGVGKTVMNARIIGDINLDIDSTLHTVDAAINPGVITNNEINSAAGIVQSKLTLNSAGTRANATGITQADRGLASFDSNQFNSTDGWISIKDNGISLTKIGQIGADTVLGNSTSSTANVSAVTFSTVVNEGGGIKKTQYGSTGFLRRISSLSGSNDGDYAVVDMTANYTGASDNGKIINRDSNGDFSARIANLDSLKIDSNTAIDSSTTATGGYLRYYAFGSNNGGIYISDGTGTNEKRTQYWNDSHVFKTQDGNFNAPVTCSQLETLLLTTGGNTTAGQITGRWTLTGSSPNESRLQATYSADLAEYYEGDKDYEVGTVLIFDGEKEVTISSTHGDTRVAGVVSNTAAFVMYDACPGHKNLVALQGRVPCKVIGKIKKGDLLVTSNIAGVAISAGNSAKTGTVIGKALQNYDSDHIGKIEIAVGRT